MLPYRLDPPAGYKAIALRTPTLPPAEHTNCYVVGMQGALIVDPGSPFSGEIKALLNLVHELLGQGATFAGILLTHHHPDHVGGADVVSSRLHLPVIAHPETSRLLAPGLVSWVVDEGDRLEVDGCRKIQVLHTPGHAAGHICLFEDGPAQEAPIGPKERVLIGGDMVPGLGTTLIEPDEGSMRDYLDSLERLAGLEIACLMPAHGPALRPGSLAARRLIEHRLMREARVLAALEQAPAPLNQITRKAYAEASPAQVPLAVRSTRAHLEKLEDEGRARRCGELWCLTPESADAIATQPQPESQP
jgi:ribonuclease/clavin/mitogillin